MSDVSGDWIIDLAKFVKIKKIENGDPKPLKFHTVWGRIPFYTM